MILDLSVFTWVHMLLSVVAVVAGVAVVKALLELRVPNGWTAVYLAAAILTSVTGFGFPFDRFIDSHWTGVVSLIALALALIARYGTRFAGAWRWIYALGMVFSVYLLFVVLIAQAFKKVPVLTALAPTQTEPAFVVAQLVLLAIFVWIAIKATRIFRPAAAYRISSISP